MTDRFSASQAPRLIQCPSSGNLDVAIEGWVPPVVDHDKGAKGKGTEIHKIFENSAKYTANDMLMIAKYFERIADHATNIAEWVQYAVSGLYKGEKLT